MNLVIAALFIAGIVTAGTGALILSSARRGAGDYTRARATVSAVMLGERPNTVKPVVEFTAGGKSVRQSAGEVKADSFTAQPGDEVEIAYRRHGVLDADFWEIVLDQNDVETVIEGQNSISTVLGWLLSGIGAVIIVVAVVLLRR